LKEQLAALENQMTASEFWNDSQKAQKVIAEANGIKSRLNPLIEIERKLEDLPVLIELITAEPSDAGVKEILVEQDVIAKALDQLEIKVLLANEMDANNAIISLHAGAGGTEACDWANMLLRMYTRYCERAGYKITLMDVLQGEEAGIRNASLLVEGEYAYGYLKNERGVHRLVRISPFNSQGKRQTSFASLDVIAQVADDIKLEIPEGDIRVDVFRAGGHGGQGVNTTDSAVRITHLPSGLIVTCQNERSQIKNRASAMSVLKSRLYELELEKKRQADKAFYGEKNEIGFGRQIRSYVFQPYQMVKDLRTGEQATDIQSVMDGEIQTFIEAQLRGKKRSDADVEEED
jgi:peptide chain release factor 2